MEKVEKQVTPFKAGNISNNFEAWQQLTNDPFILDVVKQGLKLSLNETPNPRGPFEPGMGKETKAIISNEIKKLLDKGVIKAVAPSGGEFFSHLFTRKKKDGTFRTILNLKPLNKYCSTSHFKMENIHNVFSLIKKNSYLASIDLKDAFFTVGISEDHKKYLHFVHEGISYQFQCMPNGYSDAMRVFTKILKPVFAYLRDLGYMSVVYVDDTLLVGDTYEECLENVNKTMEVLEKLGFTIHQTKSVFKPTQIITFLGFIINTTNMTLSLSQEKRQAIFELICKLENDLVSTRMVATLLGKMSSVFEAVPLGRLHFRHLETDKINALKSHAGNFDSPCPLSQEALCELVWWKQNIFVAARNILHHPIDYTISTDASNEGWGANDSNLTINGRWSTSERNFHINYLEMKAIYLALKSFLPLKRPKHVRVLTDNQTALTYINKRGGIQSYECNSMAIDIWNICQEYDSYITASHIPGVHNILADTASRKFDDSKEWMLDPIIFSNLCSLWGTPSIDLFASRLNKQINDYVSYLPDPDSTFIDAFSIRWNFDLCYLFPPFSVIHPVLRKIKVNKAKAILIVPIWPTQSWWPAFRKMSSRVMEINSRHLTLPGCPGQRHPLHPKLRLMAGLLDFS